jgi:methanogenic corrinoid protein MtbC1
MDEPRHPIQVVARRTGLTPDVLRVWEKRHEVVGPSRSSFGRRLYSDREVERLLLLRRATLAGRRIGQVARLTDDELRALVASDERAVAEAPLRAGPAGGEHLESCWRAVERMDGAAVLAALSSAAVSLGSPAVLERVLAPILHRVGDAWRDGTLRVAQEHLASAAARTFLSSLRTAYATPSGAPVLVATTPAGQLHELGALMAAVTAAADGWDAAYLGPNLPADEVAMAAERSAARAVALSVVYPADDLGLAQELRRLRASLPDSAALVVGGRAAPAYDAVLREIGAIRVGDLPDLRSRLAGLRA